MMKRLKSSDDLESHGEKSVVKDWGRREEDSGLHRSSSSSLHRNSHYKASDSGRKVMSSSTSRYERLEDDRESSRLVRKRPDYEVEDRRKSYDRQRDGKERGILSSSPRAGYGMEKMYRSESFSGPRRDFPKGFRSERDRSRRDGSVTSWRRYGNGKDGDDLVRSGSEMSRGDVVRSGSEMSRGDVGRSVSEMSRGDVGRSVSEMSRGEVGRSVSEMSRGDVGRSVSEMSRGDVARSGSEMSRGDVARSGSEVSRGNRMGSEEFGKAKSPRVVRDAKSPAWSKDSGSEQSKSIEIKKYDDKSVESDAPSSEREEGELEPDPQPHGPLTEPVNDESGPRSCLSPEKPDSHGNEQALQDKKDSQSVETENTGKIGSSEDVTEAASSKAVHDVLTADENVPDSREAPESEMAEESGIKEGVIEQDDAGGSFDDNLSSLQEKREDTRSMDLEMKEDRIRVTGKVEETDRTELPLPEVTNPMWKDKGKSIALSPSNSILFPETNLEVKYKARDLLTSGDVEMEGPSTDIEGPSTRGFLFLSSDPIKKQERVEQSNQTKPKDDKLALDLSLSLPNVLLPIGVHDRGQAPGSPSHAGSVQSFPSSFRTNSESFMPSMSYSGSQQFTHNPSCSLTTNNTCDFEQSVKSKPLFKGMDWKAFASDENKNIELPTYQGTSSKANGYYQPSQVSQANSNGQGPRVTGGSSKELVAVERQLSFNRSLSEKQRTVSHENGSERFKEGRQVSIQKDGGGLRRSLDSGKEEILAFGADYAESIVTMIVSEPLQTISQKFGDMAEHHIACVRKFVLDIFTNPGKQWQLSALQNAMRKKTDTRDMLIDANRNALEMMVALKTGLKEFLLQKHEIPPSELAEIFVNMRCRNLSCRSLLPVDECDCKICAQRSGFCRECMCLVCLKFDNASNTCSWVGCDVCLHWCHADCGLRESYIRNGRSASDQGTTEMQFHCVACGHPSEMFGFVKEVFQNFVKEWTAENLSRELEYVRKIFAGTKDVRGKHLHEIAIRMLSGLGDRVDHLEVRNHIMRFFTETDSLKPGNITSESRKELPTRNQERSIGFAGSSQGAGWMKSAYSDKSTPLINPINSLPQIRELQTKDHERSNGIAGSSQGPEWLKPTYPDKPTSLENVISGFDRSRSDKYSTSMEFRSNSLKAPVFDELESLVRIKHAEAKMFQTRADDARREAEALKTISAAKNERVEEEYSSRITKLRLAEAEDMRRQKVEELQDLERARHDYFSMKMRMETDIKDLLLKMEATRRNLST